MSEVLTLFDLNRLIRSVLEESLPGTFLITAEIASCNVKNHCYMTLVDKADDTIRAESGAVIWASRYRSIAGTFEKQTGTSLAKGIKILLEAEVSYHERYGLKLNIINIDPSYTIGEMAVRRKEILERLTKEGLIERNRLLEFPLVPQRIGIISSSTAAGYEDLMNHLEHNVYGYKFESMLYEALMQGERAEASIVAALGKCAENAASLDLVVIVRGGGGQTDLHCFDSYEIGKAVAFLPLPVVSGIGHQRDVTVLDEISNMRAKTPTAVADLIITRVKEFEDRLDSSAHALVRGTREMTADMRGDLSSLSRTLEALVRNELLDNSHRLATFIKGLRYALKFIKNENRRLKTGEGNIKLLDPKSVLKRGYSITYNDGKAVRSIADIQKGDSIRTVLYDGEVASQVTGKK